MKRKFFLTLLFLLISVGTFLARPTMTATAQTEEVPVACIAQGLLKYMDAIIQGTQGLKNIRLLSPAFNLTNPNEFAIFEGMKTGSTAQGAGIELFKKLWGFAGNTYTLNGIRAMDFVLPKNNTNGAGYNWIGEAAGAVGKPFVFTEFGDFDTWKLNGVTTDKYGLYPGGTDWGTVVNDMKSEFDRAASQGVALIAGINYFAALPGNPEFTGHNLTDERIRSITSGDPARGGINSAQYINAGAFQSKVAAVGANLGWTVEIITGSGDLQSAVKSVSTGYSNNMKTVLRACVGNSCEFSDPSVYVAFLRNLDALLDGIGPVYVIAGPNEPATERWATPGCRIEKPFKLKEIPCDQVTDPEFHSLRPYPTSPCVKNSPTVMMCGQDFVVQEKIKLSKSDSSSCTNINLPDGTVGSRCTFDINSTSNISLGLHDAQFPIMGNTELVPNSTSGESILSFPQRVNEYVSWYMNGVTARAEEEPDTTNTPKGINNIVSLSGPLKRLLPKDIQTSFRVQQQRDLGSLRHNQIVACGPNDNPQTCYKNSSEYKRITDVIQGSPISQNFFKWNPVMLPYVPFSSTEDLIGKLNMGPKGVSGEVTDVQLNLTEDTKKLYFAHQAETPQLANLLQKTFVSRSFVVDKNVLDGQAPTDQVTEQNNTPYCEIIDTKSNPGDKLYGDLQRDGTTPIGGTMTYKATLTCDFGPTIIDPVAYADCMAIKSDPAVCKAEATVQPSACEKQITVPFGVNIETPNAYEVWDKYVAGNFSIFQRMYPKVGPGTPVEKIKDIPGDSPASYTSSNASFSGAELLGNAALAGNPFALRSGSSAKIYFAHIGSVYEYFLQGIQKALRPVPSKLPNGSEPPVNPAQCAPINCNLNAPTPEAKYARIKPIFVDLANRLVAGAGKNFAAECFNDVVAQSLAKGVNPVFTLSAWLHESDASNYGLSSGCTIADFGIVGGGVPPANFQQQLSTFLNLPSAYENNYPACYTQPVPAGYEGQVKMLAFNYIYLNGSNGGTCSNPLNPGYYNALVVFWNWLAPQCTVTNGNLKLFSISSPQDMSCP